jgi:Fe-S cluster biogenesis protein NfuA
MKKHLDKITVEEKIRPVLDAYHANVELVEVTADGFLKVRITGVYVSCHDAKKTILKVIETAFREVICSDIKGVILVGRMRKNINNVVNLFCRDITKRYKECTPSSFHL